MHLYVIIFTLHAQRSYTIIYIEYDSNYMKGTPMSYLLCSGVGTIQCSKAHMISICLPVYFSVGT